MNTDPSKTIGFRPTQRFGTDPKGIGWRFWVGPLIVIRHPRSRFGVWVGWSR